jgi:peptidoglycan/xylan/chitin deacetylase (PgdA/CDA1 family)
MYKNGQSSLNPFTIGIPIAGAAGLGLTLWGAVSPASQLFGPTLRRLPADGTTKRIALTFDDGPNPAITPKLLALLERYRAKATFFVVGKFVRTCPEIIREIDARGHLLANHTDTHPHLAWHTGERNKVELERCEESVAEALASGSGHAKPMKWMRPPFGFRGPQLYEAMRKVGIDGVAMWSKLCYDWKPQPGENIIRRLAKVGASDILLMHDGDFRALGADREHVLRGLEHWLPRWRDEGREFVTIEADNAK